MQRCAHVASTLPLVATCMVKSLCHKGIEVYSTLWDQSACTWQIRFGTRLPNLRGGTLDKPLLQAHIDGSHADCARIFVSQFAKLAFTVILHGNKRNLCLLH